jgi:hypothetical protein
MVRTLTFNRHVYGRDPMRGASETARRQRAAISLVMALTDAFASPNSIAVFGS